MAAEEVGRAAARSETPQRDASGRSRSRDRPGANYTDLRADEGNFDPVAGVSFLPDELAKSETGRCRSEVLNNGHAKWPHTAQDRRVSCQRPGAGRASVRT